MAAAHASRPQSQHIHERDRNFKELVAETLWLIDSQASRVRKSWPGDDTAIPDFLSAVSAHVLALSVRKLGPQSAREMLNQQLGKIKSVN